VACHHGQSRKGCSSDYIVKPPSLGAWIWAGIIVTVGVMILEAYDAKAAMTFAILVLLAMFLRYPAALDQIRAMLGTVRGGTTNPTPAPRR
jgi:hypothetical protein